MISEPDPVTQEYDAHLPVRPEMALYGIYEISKILCGPGSLQEILVTTLSVLKSFLDMGNGLIALLDETGRAEMVVSGSFGSAHARRYFEALPERAIGQLVVTEIPLAVADVGRDSVFRWDTSAWGPPGFSYSFMGVPIKDRDRVVGTLTIDRAWLKWGSVQVDDDLRFLKMVANLVGQTVRLHRIDYQRPHTVARRAEPPLETTRRGVATARRTCPTAASSAKAARSATSWTSCGSSLGPIPR